MARYLLALICAAHLCVTFVCAGERTGYTQQETLEYLDLSPTYDSNADYATGADDLENLLNTDEPLPCGNGKNCIEGRSTCNDGKCKCTSPYTWNNQPFFMCYESDSKACEVKLDPLLVTYARQKTKFPFPCRYLITHVIQPLSNSTGDAIGTCEFQVFGFNARRLGKFFVLGFDIAIELQYNNTGETVKRSTRSYSVINNTMPQVYTVSTRDEYYPDGPWNNESVVYNDTDNGISISIFGDNSNKQMVYEAQGCGLRITFVPYDIYLRRDQLMLPGISINVDEVVNVTQYLSNDTAMALSPDWGDELGYLKGLRLPGLSDEQSMFVRAFTRDIDHNQPFGDKDQCNAVGDSLQRCDDDQRDSAFDSCYWMVKEERFMRCFDTNPQSEDLMKLFEKCIDMWCADATCSDVQDMISAAGCDSVRDISSLRNFMRGDMCP